MAQARSRFWQDIGWRAEALGFDVFTLLMRALPPDVVSGLGAVLARAVGPLTRNHKTAERNTRLAFPDMSEAERKALLKAQWANVGRTFFELPIADRLTPGNGRVEVVGGEQLTSAAREGRPLVLISGHFSNWEIMAAVILACGLPCEITYRAANNPYVDRRIIAARRRYGVRLFAPKGDDGARELLGALKAGVSVAMLNDQKYDGGVAAPFFGREVLTLPAAVRLALRFGADLQPMSIQRAKGARFRCVVHPPIPVPDTGDKTADVEAGVRAVNAFIEARVRERPSEWFWVHRRWPAADYAALAAQGL